MILMTRGPEEYIAGTTSLLIDDAGGGYYVDVVKKDAPADFIAEMKEYDVLWRKEHHNQPYFIFPDDPEYEKYFALIE